MRRLAQLVSIVAAFGSACSGAVAEEHDRYQRSPAASWPDRPIQAATATQATWPAASEAAPAGAPRTLPAAYQAPAGAAGSAPSAQPLGTLTAPRAIPLTRAAEGAGSFGNFAAPSLTNAAASLGIVLGLFIAVVWAVRRGMPRGSGLLPCEAVEVLGRAPLIGRQQVYLVRCGNKIVLLNVTAGGVEPLTEITDPAEVDRLHSVCQPPAPGGSLRQWLGHVTGQSRAAEYFAREQADTIDFGHLDAGQHRA